MFAVSRCPSCRRLHGLELPARTTTCRLCGKRYDPSKGAVIRTFPTDVEMRGFLQGAACIDGGSDQPVIDLEGIRSTRSAISGSKPGRGRILKLVLSELKAGPKSFSDLTPIANEGNDPEMLEECLASLMEQGIVFRGRDGRYSLVE